MRFNTRLLGPILTSAYLSAMLTSSVAPIRNSSIFAATVDPTAAHRAFQDAVSGLDASGWAAAVAGNPSTPPPAPIAVPVPAPVAEPVMTDELMARLIKFASIGGSNSVMPKKISGIFGLNDGTEDLPIMQATEPLPEGKHYFMLSAKEGSNDVVIAFKPVVKGDIRAYLTNRSGVLRAAAILNSQGIRLITNEQAARDFKAEMQLFAKIAKNLPPAGAAVPGNS